MAEKPSAGLAEPAAPPAPKPPAPKPPPPTATAYIIPPHSRIEPITRVAFILLLLSIWTYSWNLILVELLAGRVSRQCLSNGIITCERIYSSSSFASSTLILEVENGAKVWVDGVEAIVQFVGRKGLDLKTVRGEVLYGVAADTVRNDFTALLVYRH